MNVSPKKMKDIEEIFWDICYFLFLIFVAPFLYVIRGIKNLFNKEMSVEKEDIIGFSWETALGIPIMIIVGSLSIFLMIAGVLAFAFGLLFSHE